MQYWESFCGSLFLFVNKTPKISVILPFYNAANTLIRAIKSIIDQSHTNWECILINNNSTDDSVEIAKHYVDKDYRFQLVNEARQGVVFASDAGYLISCGEYICRMDADDFSMPNRFFDLANFLDRNHDYAVVTGLVEYVAHRKETKGFERYVNWVNSVQTYRDIFNSRFIESPIVNPSAIWRRDIVEKYGFYKEGDFPEDYELWLRWLDCGVKIHKLPVVVLKWHDSDQRLTRTDKRYRDKAFYHIKTKYLAKWLTENNPLHPDIAVWGASRISRKRAGLLEYYGINIDFYIDISLKRNLKKEVVNYKHIPDPHEVFILTYIRQANARQEIKEFLLGRGFVEGKNFLMIS